MADEKTLPKLSALLDGKFKMAKGFNPGRYTFKGISIDTRTCSVAQAQAFVDLGSNVIVADTKKADKPA